MKSRVEIEERISRLEKSRDRVKMAETEANDEWADYYRVQWEQFNGRIQQLRWVLND